MLRNSACSRLLLAGCFSLASLIAFGHKLGSIGGEVRDALGAIVPGAAISATDTIESTTTN